MEKIKIPIWEPVEFFKDSLKKFNSFSSIISGSRTSGKSVFLKYLLVHSRGPKLLKQFDSVVIFSSSVQSGFWNFTGSKLLFKKFNPGVVKAMKKIYFEQKSKGIKFRFLVILDDLAFDTKLKYDNAVAELYVSGRHFGASVCYITQKSSATNQMWKANSTVFIICFSASRKEKKYLAEDVIADAIDHELPNLKENDLYRIGTALQTKLLKNHNAIIITPYYPVKISQFRPELVKDRKKQISENNVALGEN